jgi:NifB/MoaA-like Fe-S oxidoreductase
MTRDELAGLSACIYKITEQLLQFKDPYLSFHRVGEFRLSRSNTNAAFNMNCITAKQTDCRSLRLFQMQFETIVKLLLKHLALPVKVTLNRNYPRQNSVCFVTLRQFRILHMSSVYIYISFQSCIAVYVYVCVCIYTPLTYEENIHINHRDYNDLNQMTQ